MLNKFGRKSDAVLPFAERLARLGELGFGLRPSVTAADLVATWGEDNLESGGWLGTLSVIGYEAQAEGEPGDRFPDRVLYWDTECIENEGDYVAFLRAVERLYAGELVFEDASDRVDQDAEEAELRFTVRGVRFSSPMTVQDDWLDLRALEMVLSVAARFGVGRRIGSISDDSQCLLLVSGDARSLDALRTLTGLKIDVLEVDPGAFPPIDSEG